MMELRTAGDGPFGTGEATPLLPIRSVFSIVVLLLPALGYACSCASPENVSERYVLDRLCAADAVFVGEIESELTVRDDVFEYKIWPSESFKGRLNSPAFAVSETYGMCGYPFNAQSRYLIFASRRKNTNYLSASICGLTRPLDREDEVYKILVANKDAIEEVCGEEAVAARRLERLREKGRKRQDLEEATRRLWDSKE
jgi:hypothetical protein